MGLGVRRGALGEGALPYDGVAADSLRMAEVLSTFSMPPDVTPRPPRGAFAILERCNKP